MGSLLHDIGKQFIPIAVLEKKDRLSRKEFRQIQEHPWIGYSYLTHFVSDPIILNTVLYHHERWNGTGYPFGLEGEGIPLGARICALADVWDALISNRSYRSAWSLSRAVDLIWAGAGSLFDPQLTYQFLSMIADQFSHNTIVDVQETPALPIAGRDAPALKHVPLSDLKGEKPVS
jgi:HD-GYP domain-containing protein (c-di-GMP phosphodiesterase class II)